MPRCSPGRGVRGIPLTGALGSDPDSGLDWMIVLKLFD